MFSKRLGLGGDCSVATGFLGLILSNDKAILTLKAVDELPLNDD